jgi:streptogramin lyase
MLAANPGALQVAKDKLNAGLTSPLTYVGLIPASFDPVKTPYQAVKTDTYDRLLERVIVSKDRSRGNTVVVGTFAGVKESFLNGAGKDATFGDLFGVAIDSSGNAYVADVLNHAIRKITPDGVVSTFAGSGSPGFANGTGTAASFYWPRGVAVDSVGNVYVADSVNNAIRKITAAGVVSTLAGGSWGFSNGNGTTATFHTPYGVAVDGNGNVFVADTENYAIRKITPVGVVSTVAGSGTAGFTDGTGTTASFNQPMGVAVDSSGNIFVGDTYNHAIRKITPTGVVSTIAGSGSAGYVNGTGIAASFSYPGGIAVDGRGNVFVPDTQTNNAIRKIDSVGGVTTFADIGGTAVAADSNGNVFVAAGNVLHKITSTGFTSTIAGSGSSGFSDGSGTAARFSFPTGVAVESRGTVYVADFANYAIRKISPAGVVSTFAGGGVWVGTPTNGIGSTASFRGPNGVAVDGVGNVYVADQVEIRKITPAGVVSTLAGGIRGFTNGTGTAARFDGANGVAVDSDGNVFVADLGNDAIRKISPTGVVTTFAGGARGFIDGTGTAASFSSPEGVTVDNRGNVFVADGYPNNAIRKITSAGVVTTFAGNGAWGVTNGAGTAASFGGPKSVVVDTSGNVFVADYGNSAIRKITPAGVVTTLSGDGTMGYRNDTGTGARFYGPMGVAVDKSGNVFVGDSGNNAIRIILP